MDNDKAACAEVIQAWGFARDQGRWDDLAAIFHSGGEIAVSWFRGPYSEFVAHCRRNFGRGSEAKHLLWPARVAVNGARASAETNVAILVRQTIEGVPVDLTAYSRFLDRLERREGEWRILERAAIYEQDRLDTVEPSTAFGMVMKASSAQDYPEPYRYMALRLASAGRALVEPVHHDGSAPTRELYARYEAWFAGA